MAKIRPFKGIRPPKEFVAQVVSRPYDVLNSEEAREEAKGNENRSNGQEKTERKDNGHRNNRPRNDRRNNNQNKGNKPQKPNNEKNNN
mgnify:CR=1 FL=1